MPTQINQVYTLVNSVVQQALGSTALTVTDTQSLVALGNTILSSANNTEVFLNTLVQRIGKTIFSYRRYDNHYADFMLNDFEYGAIVQKIKVSMPSAVEDESYGLTDGESVDMYTVAKPVVHQKLFTKETPYSFYITIQREYLKEAFLSLSQLDSFIGYIYGEVENKINMALETLCMECINNYIAEASAKTNRVFNLVTMYNAASGDTLTSDTALLSPEFMKWAIATIKVISTNMTRMTSIYNDGTETRHTPKEYQRMLLHTEFINKAETMMESDAFNRELVRLEGYKEVPFWQAINSPMSINVKRASDGNDTSINNIICCLFDRDALGIYKKDEWTATTPFNAKGGYTNTFWHMKELYINDLSENFVYFTLN